MNLLIVDDEILAIQGLIEDMPWGKLGFEEIFTATSYAQAVNLFRNHPIDIFLCDIEMPLKSGIELVKWAKENYPEALSIFLTCHDDFAFAQKAIALESIGYILKPADTAEITEVLHKAIAKAEKKKGLQTTLPQADALGDLGELAYQNSQASIKKVEHHIQLHLTEPLTVNDLALVAGMSVTQLSRVFKKKHQLTLIDYITAKRMDLACQLLTSSDLPISIIALRTGYDNYSYFTKIFKKHTGETPREYRNRNRIV